MLSDIHFILNNFIGIARALKSKVFCDAPKRAILSCLDDKVLDDLITSDPMQAKVHVMKIGQLNYQCLSQKLNVMSHAYDQILAIRPTGWTFNDKKSNSSNTKSVFSVHSLKATYISSKITLVGLPYSEHSSFSELKDFICAVDPKKIIPTVNISRREEMASYFASWIANKDAQSDILIN